jgi:hypothetical protein
LQLAWVRLGISDQFRHRIDRQLDMDRKADDVRSGIGNGREVLHRIERRILVEKDVAGHDGVGTDHQRVAVGWRARDVGGGDIAAYARSVVDNDGLAPSSVEPFGHRAREKVAGRTRRIADHDGNRSRRIILRHRRRGDAVGDERENAERTDTKAQHHATFLPCPVFAGYGRA